MVPVGDPSGPCAQVVATAGERAGHDDLLLYSHLDTSLSGEPRRDVAVTGRSDAAAPLVVDLGARTVQGFGLAVAKAPAAAALVGFARAAEHLTGTGEPFGLRLLLAARGTHGAPGWSLRDGPVEPVPVGVETLLAAGRPRAAVVAKAGPAGVLYDEPGACYLRVQARTGWGAVMARDRLVPEGGVLAHLGVLADAVETAGRQLVQAAPAGAQSGAQFGIGAVRSGLPGKPDLAPGVVEVFCYFVAPGPLPAGATASAMAALLAALLVGSPLESAVVTVVDHVVHAGAATDPDAAVVRAARRAWASSVGPRCRSRGGPVPPTGSSCAPRASTRPGSGRAASGPSGTAATSSTSTSSSAAPRCTSSSRSSSGARSDRAPVAGRRARERRVRRCCPSGAISSHVSLDMTSFHNQR